MSSDTVQGAENEPLRPGFGRTVRRWAYMLGAAVLIWIALGFVFELVWPGGPDFDWRRDLRVAVILATGMTAAFAAVDHRYERAALDESGHPEARRANLLFLVVLVSSVILLNVLWDAISR